jgi:hypothetical protein
MKIDIAKISILIQNKKIFLIRGMIMLIENFSVDGLRFEYGKFSYDQYNLQFIVEGVTHDSEFVRLSKAKLELDLYRSKELDKETWQDKPKKVATLTPIEPIASAAQALASATPVSATVSAMTDTVPVVKRGRGRPRKVQQ